MTHAALKRTLSLVSLLLVISCAETPVAPTLETPTTTESPTEPPTESPQNSLSPIDSTRPTVPPPPPPALMGIPINSRDGSSAKLYPADFKDLSAWEADQHAEAFAAFAQSCRAWKNQSFEKGMSGAFDLGAIGHWAELCAIPVNSGEERQFFETWFRPYLVADHHTAEGLFTGYYLPELHGSMTRSERYRIPLYRKPDDLVQSGGRSGRWANGHFRPYYNRSEIYQGALENRNLELVWVDDPIDAYFMEVQGSGRVLMDDGSVKNLGYAAKNGRAYFAIGKALVDRGEIAKEAISMQTIRTWIEQHPAEGLELMTSNASYVFFRELPMNSNLGPVGALGVPLTAKRSLAVDRHYWPLGIPIWLEAEHPTGGARLQRLLIAQDTGGAIKGAVRGDFYWGQGSEAATTAGPMKSKGWFYLLLPRSLYDQP
jgi:membrane-bound lytic murein transglycosylase A